MKVALVHELLTMRGGAEKVLRILAAMYPDAPIYTLLYDKQRLGDWFPSERVRPSVVQSRAVFSKNHHLYLRQFPHAVEQWDFSEFDLVISSSSAFAHGIITNGRPKHLCYVQSPARYLWDRTHDVLDRAGRGLLGPLKRRHLERIFHELRIWDTEAAARPDMLLAASKEVQRRIELYWRRESTVVYPPIDDTWLKSVPSPSPNPSPYFFIASTLVPYKRIDLAIHACNKANVRLVIAGDGPARRSLAAIAGPTIEFVGFKNENELKGLYANAQATIIPGEEDFGLVPLESMACGTPVIAYNAGGVTETVTAGTTGTLFSDATPNSAAAVIASFNKSDFNPATCRAAAEKFSRVRFEEGVLTAVNALMK